MTPELDVEGVRRGGLHELVRRAWSHVDVAPFRDSWHVGAICEHLQAQTRFEIPQLIINIPPAHSKSLLTNVFWPVYNWILDPTEKWFYASFDRTLPGQRDGGKVLRLLRDPWFLARWGNLLPRKIASASNFDTAAGGFRYATSPGAGGTGRHADRTVIDDPTKPLETVGDFALTKRAIRKVSLWYGSTIPTRRTDATRHTRTLIMQRLHEEDLAGELKAQGGWEVLSLPLVLEGPPCRTTIFLDPRKTGDILAPERFPAATVEAMRATTQPDVWAAQQQQEPQRKGGNIFLRERWRFWGEGNEPCLCDECWIARKSKHDTGRPMIALPEKGQEVDAWDMTFKGKVTSDFVAGTRWRASGRRYFLRKICNARMDFAKTLSTLLAWGNPGTVLIEDAANGSAIESAIKAKIPVTMRSPGGGHEARAHAVQPLFETEHVFLPDPATCPEVWDLMAQAEVFPRGINDDMVDSVTHALLFFLERSGGFWKDKMVKK